MSRLKKYSMAVMVAAVSLLLHAERAFTIEADDASSCGIGQNRALLTAEYAVGQDENVVSRSFDMPLDECNVKSNAFVRIRNRHTGKSVRLSRLSPRRNKIRITQLLLAELKEQALGDGDTLECTLGEKDGAGERILDAQTVSCGNVSTPAFLYGENGTMRRAVGQDRTLLSVELLAPSPVFAPDVDEETRARLTANIENDLSLYSFQYELPNGDVVTHLDAGDGIDGGASFPNYAQSSDAGSFNIINFNGIYDGDVGFTPMDSAMLAVIQYACRKWSGVLNLQVPVKFKTGLAKSLPAQTIGCSWSQTRYDSARQCFFAPALINQLNGADLAPDSDDIVVAFNPSYPFYLGVDGKCPSTKQDLASTAIHELFHGLGFASNHARFSNNGGRTVYADGSYIGSKPAVFDKFLYYNGKRLVDLTDAGRKTAYTSNALYWDGDNAKAGYGGARPKMYAPTTYQTGSSVSHWDDSNTFKTFMHWSCSFGEVCHDFNAVTLGACKDMGYTLANDVAVKASPSSVTLSAQAANNGSFSVAASSSWTVSKSDTWITLKTTSGSGNGTVSYSVSANTASIKRTGTITVTCGGSRATHTITQSPPTEELSISPTGKDFDSASGNSTFNVKANGSWSAAKSASWIALNTTTGNGNGTISYSVSENNGGVRTGTITVKSGSLTATYEITQAAQPQLSIDPGAKTFSAAAGNGTITVASDSMWTVSKSVAWIKLGKTSGSGNGTVTYTVEENTGGKREGWIYVTCGTVQRTLFVTQNRRDTVTFSEESATVPYSGGTGTFTVTILANNYYVTTGISQVDWANWSWTSDKLAEGIRYTCTYAIEAAPSYEKRTVKIPITFNETTYYYTITQGFGADTYRVSYDPGANGRGFAFYNLKTHDVSLTLAGASFTRTGYTQKGWATTDGAAKVYDLGASYTKNEAITLYPYWEKDSSVTTTYTIRFSPGSYGTGAEQAATKYKGVALMLPGAIYDRTGYEQTGWSTVRSGTTKTYNLGGNYTADADAYLYPYWTVKESDESEIGFYVPGAYKQPVSLSSTNVAYWAYAPQYVFEQGCGLILNYCVKNYSDHDVTLVDRHMSLWDSDYNMIEAEMESYADTIPAGKGMLFPNRDCSAWLSHISPGNYAMMVYLDPYDKLNDPYDSDNAWLTWFAVKADGISYNEALDCNSLYFTDNGSSAFTQTSESIVGGSCVQFGPQPSNSVDSVMWAYVEGSGTLSFKWKACANDYKACMVFYVDNEMKQYIWGEDGDWADLSIELEEGSRWVRWELWTYDASPFDLTSGWLDAVVWNPSGVKPTFTIDSKGTLTSVKLNGVKDVEIPNKVGSVPVREIGSRLFEKTDITSVSIPNCVTNIADWAFLDCTNLKGITIPGSVKSIGETAFCRCYRMTSVALEEGVERIGKTAFYDCLGLTYVKLPASVADIGDSPFGHCPNLKTIVVADGNPRYSTIDYVLVDKIAKELIQYPMGRMSDSYEVPDGIATIAYDAFDWATNLTVVTLPSSLRSIENCAFIYCSNLTTVNFKGNAPTVGGAQAFLDVAPSCKAVVLPQSSGWGVAIPGTWHGLGIEYSYALQTYSVLYKPGSHGTGAGQSDTKSHGVTLPLMGAIFTRTGYDQTGWATSDGGTKAYDLGSVYTIDASVALYPYWTANTYNVSYNLDGGAAGSSSPTSATYGNAFRVSSPTRTGYKFVGWMITSGLDTSTAKYGASASSQSAEISNSGQQCFNDIGGDVWFVNLTPVADGAVVLTATWEKAHDNVRDIGFYAPMDRGWLAPICLSSTNIAYLAYAPEKSFAQYSDVFLNYCAVNWNKTSEAYLHSTLVTIQDSADNVINQAEFINGCALGAYGYQEIRNINLRTYLAGLTPGSYKLTATLDPNGFLEDYDRSNNTTSIWVTIKSNGGPTPPSWTPVAKEDTMVVYATVFDASANAMIEEVGTRLGAFAANGECRGWTTIMEGPISVGRLFQLSVGVESATESGIVLKVWNPQTGEVVEIPERIACNGGRQLATIANPHMFKVRESSGGVSEIVVNLNEGWNWISTCIVAEDPRIGSVFAGCTFANDDVVKTSNGSATYYNGMWYPSAYTIDPGVAYVVKKSAGGMENAILRGALMHDGIPVKEGWNWIGMPLTSMQSVSDIKHSVGFSDDDVIKDSNASATYYEGQWYPSTFSFRPGMGYKANLSKSGMLSFRSAAAGNSLTAVFQADADGNAINDSSSNPGWIPVTQEDTMVAYLQIRKPDGSGKFESAGSVLAAFSSSGECRGVAEVMDGPAGKVYQLSIGVVSATESGFSLRIWDSDSGQVYSVAEELTCNSEKLIGKIFNPQVLAAMSSQPSACTVSFSANGGSGSTTVVVAMNNPIGALPTPTRDGYVFLGWFTEQEGGTKITTTTIVTKDETFYAHWQCVGTADGTTIIFKLQKSYDTEADGTYSLNLSELVGSASTPRLTVKGLPTGIKFDSKAGVISGKATKPGVYKVTVGATNATVKKAVTATFDIVVPNLASEVLPGLEQETDAYGVMTCGVMFDPGLVDCTPKSGWTVKVAGLPAGLKYDAKTSKITGVPTKAGTYTVTFTASKKGEANQVATITLNVEAAPEWATGTFSGYVAGTGNGERGTATMTVAANGKISGKLALDGTSWAFKADSYSTVGCRPSSVVDGAVETNFVINAIATAGKAKREIELRVAATDSGCGLVNAKAEGETDDGDWSLALWRGMWKDKSTAATAKKEIANREGVYTLSLAPGEEGGYGSGYLSLTVGKDGNVKATGKLADGTSVSATSPLMYDEDAGWFVCLYAAPSAYKGGAFAAAVGFDAGAAVSSKPTCRLQPVMFTPQWSSKNPQATGEYGEGFEREVDMVGAYYDKLQKLNDYYEALRLSFDGAPEFGYVFKNTYLNDLGRKTTDLVNKEAEAVDTLLQDGLTATVNEKGAVVVAKATKPVQDKTTKEWSYNGANDGALTLSFTQATGIFKGSYTFWYDYESAYDETTGKSTIAHTSKKVSFEGILVQGDEPTMDGFYLWDAIGEYEDIKTGKIKTYKFKESYPVRLER